MAIPSFAPTAVIDMIALTASTAMVLPTSGTPTIALVSNLSGEPVYVSLGTGGVTATVNGSVAVMPMAQLALTIGTNTYIAVCCESGAAAVNIAVGN